MAMASGQSLMHYERFALDRQQAGSHKFMQIQRVMLFLKPCYHRPTGNKNRATNGKWLDISNVSSRRTPASRRFSSGL